MKWKESQAVKKSATEYFIREQKRESKESAHDQLADRERSINSTIGSSIEANPWIDMAL